MTSLQRKLARRQARQKCSATHWAPGMTHEEHCSKPVAYRGGQFYYCEDCARQVKARRPDVELERIA